MARSDSFTKKWASVPAQFERPTDALIDRGWAGGAAEDPPEAKWENWWHNRVDEALAEIEANGAMAWFEDVPYSIGATVRSGGKNWIAAIASIGTEPGGVDDAGHWQGLSLEIASQAEAEDGDEATSSNVKRMTPLRVLQAIKARISSASETIAGMLRIATQAETDAGVRDDVAVTPKKLAGAVDFAIIYPNGGTEASPATIAANMRYPEANPFPGYYVDCVLEVWINGNWFDPGTMQTSGSTAYGAKASQINGGDIIVRTLLSGIHQNPALSGTASPDAAGATTSAPCRVKVRKVKGATA